MKLSAYPLWIYFSELARPACAAAFLLAAAALPLHGQTSRFYDFENFSPGTILNQQGWSAGTDSQFLAINGNTTSEQITTNASYSGNQSWKYISGVQNGYSFGPGTPFSPNLGVSTSWVGSVFQGSFRFLPSVAGDGSWMEFDTGNLLGNDRAEFIAYLNNYASATDFGPGLSVTTIDDTGTEFNVATGLNPNTWHELDFILTRTGLESNSISLSIDGGLPFVFNGVLAASRADQSFAYQVSSRLKFVASPSASGFYIDDVGYSVVPEPSTYALLLGLGVLPASLWLRRRAAHKD